MAREGKELSREEPCDGLKEFEVIDSGQFKVSLQKSRGKGEKQHREARLTHQKLGNTDDSVRIYMREMGTVPLLNRETEVEVAKRIERAQMNVLKAVSRCPLAVRELLAYGRDLGEGMFPLTRLVNFKKEELTEENLAARQSEVCERIAEVGEWQAKVAQLRRGLRQSRQDSPRYKQLPFSTGPLPNCGLPTHPQFESDVGYPSQAGECDSNHPGADGGIGAGRGTTGEIADVFPWQRRKSGK